MQKTLLTLALVAGLAGAANAQRSIRARSQPSSGLSLGVKAGGSLSQLNNTDDVKYESIYGYHAGVFANITLSKYFAFQPELLYSQKGAKIVINAPYDYTRRLHYVDVPLLFHVNTGGFFLEAGPQVGILVAARDKVGDVTTVVNKDENFTNADFSFIGGLGYQRKAGLGVGLRYVAGVTSINKPLAQGASTIQKEARNSVLQLYLTYSFNASK
ncbi:porin family protein [Hymenobacter negativus]|uniref:PorT family protein n=1 Tax=Hymenobacter negativus TaxID=2795026 RepID=A0ABS3QLC7_9BACT|nr:porin family protein [Hymenobacter negativus]MBO2012058.1 PorT family protein [Hymenobacter negativus]